MTRYTICFDEERDASILQWMDAQANKSMSLKALVERSIAQEGYNDIFQVAWKRNIQNSTQMPGEPEPAAALQDIRQTGRKRGRPRKNISSLPVSSTSSPVIPETDAAKQDENVGSLVLFYRHSMIIQKQYPHLKNQQDRISTFQRNRLLPRKAGS